MSMFGHSEVYLSSLIINIPQWMHFDICFLFKISHIPFPIENLISEPGSHSPHLVESKIKSHPENEAVRI